MITLYKTATSKNASGFLVVGKMMFFVMGEFDIRFASV